MSRHAAIEEAAAYWLMRQQEPDWSEADQLELNEWIDASSDHAAAYWRLEYGYAQFDRLRSLPAATPASRRVLNDGWTRLMAASLVLLAFLGIFLVYQNQIFGGPEATTFSTRAGQVAKIEMPDGSIVALDTDSQIRIASGDSRRIVYLDRGDAFLEVVRDERRPLHVEAGPTRVAVLGTKFLVSREADKVSVSVLSGRVRLEPNRERSANFAILKTGDVAETDGASVTVGSSTVGEISRRLAWRDGKIVFENSRIADAAAQFNRYNERKIIVADETAGEMRIGGTFRLGNIQGFARLLEESYGLKVKSTDENLVISER